MPQQEVAAEVETLLRNDPAKWGQEQAPDEAPRVHWNEIRRVRQPRLYERGIPATSEVTVLVDPEPKRVYVYHFSI